VSAPEECPRCGGLVDDYTGHTDEECIADLLARLRIMRSERDSAVGFARLKLRDDEGALEAIRARAFWQGICAERADANDQAATEWERPEDLRRWASEAT